MASGSDLGYGDGMSVDESEPCAEPDFEIVDCGQEQENVTPAAVSGLILSGLIERLDRSEERPARALSLSRVPNGDCACQPDRVRMLVATNPNTPGAVLDRLACEGPPAVRERVAENPRAAQATLRRLAFDEDPDVRMAVAENANTPILALMAMAYDDNADVRYRLAECYHLPRAILETLANDDNPYVARRAQQTRARIQSESTSPRYFASHGRAVSWKTHWRP